MAIHLIKLLLRFEGFSVWAIDKEWVLAIVGTVLFYFNHCLTVSVISRWYYHWSIDIYL